MHFDRRGRRRRRDSARLFIVYIDGPGWIAGGGEYANRKEGRRT
jgi:hypothetical protein